MIKNQMTLPLGTDTTNIKATTAVFLSATDEQVSPYTIGFVPWDLMSKCVLFGKCSRVFYSSIPNTFFNSSVYSDGYYFNPDRGVPFVYTIRTGYDGRYMHANYTSNAWHTDQMVGDTSNTNLQILHAYNTDYFVQNNLAQNVLLPNILFQFKIYEVIGDGGWSGSFETVYEHAYASVAATISDIENIGITFSHSLASHFGTYSYTITQEHWLNCDEHGIFVVEGDDYVSGGQTYKRRLYCACVHAWTPIELDTTATTPGFGVLLDAGYRSTPQASSSAWTCGWGRCECGQTAYQGYKVNPYNYQRQFPSQFGYDSFVSDDVFFFREASLQWFNHLLHGGATYEDVVVMICTAMPMYKINNSYYVAEFTDDYYITGKLIPYAQAREWQKNINGDTNEFDPADIPEPGPEPSDDIHGRHTGNTGSLFGSGVGAVSNFVTHWVLDASQVQTFGGHLWKDLLDFDAQGEPIGTQLWKNAKIAVNTYFQTGSFDPGSILELLIGLRYFPINLAKVDYATQMTVPAVYFGTGRVGVDVTTNPWKLNNCGIYITGGDLDLSQLSWNKYDDWRDVYNVSASIYIPFCGTYELPWADIYNGTLHLSYGVDVLSGALTAFVECTLGMSRFLVCVGSGMVGFEVPITATNANRINAAILGDMGNMMGTLFNPSDAAKLTSSLVGAETGSSAGIPTGDSEPTVTNAAGSAPIVGQAALAGRVAEIHAGIASRPGITCPALPGGRGWGALTGQRIPFITVRKGRYVEGTGYGHAAGYPRMKIESIGNISGYTQCINPDLSGINCTKAERDMIKQIIETGFYA